MSSLLFPSSDDFHLANGQKGVIMCTSIPDFSLILFYSTMCAYCKDFIPIFKNLPHAMGGCQFGMINVQQNKQCVLMSRETIAPITEVPYILLYVNGKPFMRYKGPPDIKEIIRFLKEVGQRVKSMDSRGAQQQQGHGNSTAHGRGGALTGTIKKNPNHAIPEYTIGHPLYGDDERGHLVCYLDFKEAYGETTNHAQNNQGRVRLPPESGMSYAGR